MRRALLIAALGLSSALVCGSLTSGAPSRPIRIALIAESWYPNSHADVIGTRIIGGYRLDGKMHPSPLTLVSVYSEAPRPNDRTKDLALRYGFKVATSVADAVLVDSRSPNPKLAVDGIVVATREDLPRVGDELTSPTPRLRILGEIFRLFDESGTRVPIFIDKMLAANWQDSRTIVIEATRRSIPLMAGSVLSFLPVEPPLRTGKVSVGVVITSAPYWAYAFHAAEVLQAYMEHRSTRESGVSSIRAVGNAYWSLPDRGLWGGQVADALLERFNPGLTRSPRDSTILLIQYADGARGVLILLSRVVPEGQFLMGAQLSDGTMTSGLIRLQGEPFDHFGYLVQALVQFFSTGRSPAAIERTLLTTGITLRGYSASRGSGATSDLEVSYTPPRKAP